MVDSDAPSMWTPTVISPEFSRFLGVTAFVKTEEDGEVPYQSTKSRRLIPYLEAVQRNGLPHIVTYGPVWSNQIFLIAEFCRMAGMGCSVLLLDPAPPHLSDAVNLSPLVEPIEAGLVSLGAKVEIVPLPRMKLLQVFVKRHLRRIERDSGSCHIVEYGFVPPETAQSASLVKEVLRQYRVNGVNGPVVVPRGTGSTTEFLRSGLASSGIPVVGLPLVGEGNSQSLVSLGPKRLIAEPSVYVGRGDLELCASGTLTNIDLFYHLGALKSLRVLSSGKDFSSVLFLKTGKQSFASTLLLRQFEEGHVRLDPDEMQPSPDNTYTAWKERPKPSHLYRQLRFLKISNQWTKERLEEWQLQSLNRLLVHCVNSVPHYSRHKVFRDAAHSGLSC